MRIKTFGLVTFRLFHRVRALMCQSRRTEDTRQEGGARVEAAAPLRATRQRETTAESTLQGAGRSPLR